MRPAPRDWRRLTVNLGLATVAGLLPLSGMARAAAPVVTVTPSGARVQVSSATLAETIDALARVADFKVTYDGARPSAMLFDAEIDTPSVAHTLHRLLDGQNLNYGVVFDLTGTKVTALMIFGTTSKTAGSAAGASTPVRPQPFATPRNPRATMPPVDDDPVEEAQPEPTPEPTPAPTPTAQPAGTPIMSSPFAPRPFGRPLVAPPTPPPTPAPSPSP